MRKGSINKFLQKLILALFFTGVFWGGYSYASGPAVESNAIPLLESVRQNYYAQVRLESLKNSNNVKINRDVPANLWLNKVKATEVNMVTNRFEAGPQVAIRINGKTYFANGEGYALNIQENPSVRFAKDPITNKIIDKADAVSYADASGRILYFESDMTFDRFVGLASSETLYGYSR